MTVLRMAHIATTDPIISMFKSIADFFQDKISPKQETIDEQHLTHLAAAALLLEVSRADFDIQDEELKEIANALQKRFKGIALKEVHNPENIPSPKEYIEKASRKNNWKPRYVNTIHNAELVQDIDLKKVQAKCPAFLPFYSFVSNLNKCAT